MTTSEILADFPGSAAPLTAEEERLGGTYVTLLGEIPPHVRDRWATLAAAGRVASIERIEQMRAQLIAENPLGLRVQQLVQFGQLLVLGSEGPAKLHANAALRHGATMQDLVGVAETALVTGGVPAFSLGVRVIAEVTADA
ncbi:MAG TPA: carboxymuconolactone decarboxylase family protein [Micromonosporaceae bacterium]|nr:carboxymuconolactone decarboxylase family protein [Micromonosporaceae bacterium]